MRVAVGHLGLWSHLISMIARNFYYPAQTALVQHMLREADFVEIEYPSEIALTKFSDMFSVLLKKKVPKVVLVAL